MKQQKKRQHESREHRTVNVLVLYDRNAAVAQATFGQLDPETGEYLIDEATGSVKREPGDERDDVIATSLAVGRALVKLGRKLQQTGRVKVESAAEREQARKQAMMIRVLDGMRDQQKKLLPVSEIRERFGPEAAERAARRRGEPIGRHARDARGEQK